jgi:hypothetical protein
VLEGLGEGPHYADSQHDVAFGDIFEAPLLLDIFVREDAALMGGGTLPPTSAVRFGKWMSTQLEPESIELYSLGLTPKAEARLALAHASFLPDAATRRAILVSDSCLTTTALAQGHPTVNASHPPIRQCRRASSVLHG